MQNPNISTNFNRMNTLFAERFKSARLLNGLSLQEVADKLDNKITRQAIYRYEKGEVIPDSIMLEELSKVFCVRSDFFFRPIKVEIGEVEYRKLQLPAKEETIIKEKTRDYLSRYLEIEEILSIKVDFVNPLEGFAAVSEYSHVNNLALQLRQEWKLGDGAIANVAELLEDKHIKVVKLKGHTDFDGLQTYVNGTIPVIAYNELRNKNKDRIRFTLLHELAHLLLKFDPKLTHMRMEKLCHQFAGAMLLPEKALVQEIGASRNRLELMELGNIKKQYGISMQAIVMRANACGIVGDKYKKEFFDLFESNGWRSDEPINYNNNEESGRFEQLIYRALAEELISISKAAALMNLSIQEFKKNYLTM